MAACTGMHGMYRYDVVSRGGIHACVGLSEGHHSLSGSIIATWLAARCRGWPVHSG